MAITSAKSSVIKDLADLAGKQSLKISAVTAAEQSFNLRFLAARYLLLADTRASGPKLADTRKLPTIVIKTTILVQNVHFCARSDACAARKR